MADDDLHRRATLHFTPDAALGWQYAIAALERLNTWAVRALRLGTLALLHECVRTMTASAPPEKLIKRARELLDALERLPWER